LSTEEISNYEEIVVKFKNANNGTFRVLFESHRLGSAFDGCPNISDHWIDAVEIFSDIDLDGDGYSALWDCDDVDPSINPAVVEIIYNGIDEDCNPLTLDDDLDQDGFVLIEDCDDQNALINSSVLEIVYNGIDDDCN